MSFSFSDTAGTSQSTVKPKLAGNNIYTVKFDGCESQDIQGVKDPNMIYKVLKLSFSNEDGVFEHTVWEPRPEDFNRRENEITNKNGMLEKIPQPSNVESMMLLFKHIIDSVNPKVAEQINKKEKNLNAKSWEELRNLVISILTPGKGTTVKIKLLKNKNGEAIFPGYFTGISREGVVYVKNNFIGDKIAFSTYELQRIQKEESARPTNMAAQTSFSVPGSNAAPDSDLDLDFSVEGI